MNKDRSNELICAILFFMLASFLLAAFVYGIETIETSGPCVDGEGDKNLEGIMCEKTYVEFYGSETLETIIALYVLLILALFLCSVANFIMFTSGDRE